MMQAILMAGGKGRRLRPITAVLPKPLVPIADDLSVLEMVLLQLRHYGFERVVLCVGHRAELVIAVVGQGRRFGLDVRFHREDRPLGTLGALAQLDDLDDDFLVMNGDICTDLDFGALLRWHRGHDQPASVAAYRRTERIELGVLELDEQRQQLVGFREKPTHQFWVAMGVNAFDRRILEMIPGDRPFGFDQLMGTMLDRGWPVRTYPHAGFWLDIGRPDDYETMLERFPGLRSELLPDEAPPCAES